MKQTISPVVAAALIFIVLAAGGVLLWRNTQPQKETARTQPRPLFDSKTGRPSGIRNPSVR